MPNSLEELTAYLAAKEAIFGGFNDLELREKYHRFREALADLQYRAEVATIAKDAAQSDPYDCRARFVPDHTGGHLEFNGSIWRRIDKPKDLIAAATGLLDRYVQLINCGDCGNWNPEEEFEVIALRAALAKTAENTINPKE